MLNHFHPCVFLEGRFVNRFHHLSIKPKVKVKACHQIKYTPGNLTLNPTHEVLEDLSPFQIGDVQVPCYIVFSAVYPHVSRRHSGNESSETSQQRSVDQFRHHQKSSF